MSTIDYRMAKRAVLRALEVGMLSRMDVCDAHPDLLRAARHIGEEASESCPVCDSDEMRLVLYAYGNALRTGSGYARRSTDLPELKTRPGEIACYIVEVCPDCNWNHLVRSFLTGQAV
ncbi:MAG: DUF5318 family protein [Actinomycetota bacterium]